MENLVLGSPNPSYFSAGLFVTSTHYDLLAVPSLTGPHTPRRVALGLQIYFSAIGFLCLDDLRILESHSALLPTYEVRSLRGSLQLVCLRALSSHSKRDGIAPSSLSTSPPSFLFFFFSRKPFLDLFPLPLTLSSDPISNLRFRGVSLL